MVITVVGAAAGLLVAGSAGLMSVLAFKLDWGVDEARAACAKAVGVALFAIVTICLLFWTRSGRLRVPRMVVAGLHLVVILLCIAAMAANALRAMPVLWDSTLTLGAPYSLLSLVALVGRRDLATLRAIMARPRVRWLVRPVAAAVALAVVGGASWYAVVAWPQAEVARSLAGTGVYLGWEGPRAVSLRARGSVAVSDADLRLLAKLPYLQSIDLSNTLITDAAMPHVAGAVHLRALYLDATQVSDAGIELLRGKTSLTWLSASKTAVTDESMPAIASLTGLRNLYLGDTGVSDAGLASLKGLRALSYLNVPGTRTTARGARALEDAIPGLTVWEGENR